MKILTDAKRRLKLYSLQRVTSKFCDGEFFNRVTSEFYNKGQGNSTKSDE